MYNEKQILSQLPSYLRREVVLYMHQSLIEKVIYSYADGPCHQLRTHPVIAGQDAAICTRGLRGCADDQTQTAGRIPGPLPVPRWSAGLRHV